MEKKLRKLYLISFLLSLQYAFTAYINSTVLASYIPVGYVGAVFTVSALISAIGLFKLPRVIEKIGNYGAYLLLTMAGLVSLMGLAYVHSAIFTMLLLSAYLILIYWIAISRDIFIEDYSRDSETGKIRGIFLTVINLSWVFAPLAAGFVIDHFGYGNVYLLAAVFLLPAIMLAGQFKDFKDPEYEKISAGETFRKIFSDKNLKSVYMMNSLLQFFYAIMIIYAPIYLYAGMGFSWETIGIIFVAMLAPFVLIQAPLGSLSDRIGEKGMLYAGFGIMALSTMALSYIGPSPAIWAIMLFVTRVGAATVEVMTESYFFKKIGAKNDALISFYRNAMPISFIAGPVLATVFLFFFPFRQIFLALGIAMALGLFYNYKLKDTV
jgi:MFS family permease